MDPVLRLIWVHEVRITLSPDYITNNIVAPLRALLIHLLSRDTQEEFWVLETFFSNSGFRSFIPT